jgi:conjugal transfer pilus assembly protein TraB
VTVLDKLKTRYAGLSNNTRLMIVGAVVVIPLIIYGAITDDNKPVVKRDNVKLADTPVTNGLQPENVAAANQSLKDQITVQQREIESLKNAQKPLGSDGSFGAGSTSELNGRIALLEKQLEILKNSPAPKGSLPPNKNEVIGDLNAPIIDKPEAIAAPETPIENKLRVIKSNRVSEPSIDSKKSNVAAYLPAGSNFEAILLNGMDAPTGTAATQRPTPALLRVKTEAILPNLFKQDIKECFLLVAAVGNMNSERAEMRTQTISCIAPDGKTFEGSMEGYIVGEDGKVGARGRLVSKQGAILAKALASGFLSGVGSAFTPVATSSLNLNSTASTQSYQYPSPDYVLGSGVAKGMQSSGSQLSQFYISLANQMFPIVEIDAGRKVTVILIKGVEVK